MEAVSKFHPIHGACARSSQYCLSGVSSPSPRKLSPLLGYENTIPRLYLIKRPLSNLGHDWKRSLSMGIHIGENLAASFPPQYLKIGKYVNKNAEMKGNAFAYRWPLNNCFVSRQLFGEIEKNKNMCTEKSTSKTHSSITTAICLLTLIITSIKHVR